MSLRKMIAETIGEIDQTVTIKGWVHSRRDMGKIIFLDVRDRSGLMQVVCVPSVIGKEGYAIASGVRGEYVVSVTGTVKARDAKQVNEKIPTGKVEVLASAIEILAKAETPPFELDKDTREVGEEIRLKYRYLDLRSERMAKNVKLRHDIIRFIREFLWQRDFFEIETPQLTKSTPEGARDFLVPSRMQPGKFFALPQSPQQYKQLLMVGGLERYFQIARCFRDEDQRGDRQPEFTQLDLEMSFARREDVLSLIESLIIALVKATTPHKTISQLPFPRFTYEEVMAKYGSDKPDLRTDTSDPNELAFCWVVDFPVFERDAKTNHLTYSHNPFTAPKAEHVGDLMDGKNLEALVSEQYDIALNGYEIGGGGIRIHDPAVLKQIFKTLGHSDEAIQAQFGHMLEAFTYGAPPHGGIALGLDRLIMLLADEPNIREVMAFPKTGDARDPMMDAPSVADSSQLQELHIRSIP